MSHLLTWLPLLITTVVFLGAASVYLKGSRDKGTIETLSRNNDALQERVVLLERSETELKTRVSALEGENEVLKGVVTSSTEIAALQVALDLHHKQAMGAWGELHTDLQDIRGALS